jgi:hypothetical protein
MVTHLQAYSPKKPLSHTFSILGQLKCGMLWLGYGEDFGEIRQQRDKEFRIQNPESRIQKTEDRRQKTEETDF